MDSYLRQKLTLIWKVKNRVSSNKSLNTKNSLENYEKKYCNLDAISISNSTNFSNRSGNQ